MVSTYQMLQTMLKIEQVILQIFALLTISEKKSSLMSYQNKIKFIDLFAGIGGFHIALHDLGCECVMACEIDDKARVTYETNFKKISPTLFEQNLFFKDVEKVVLKNVPAFDILCAGFPCQPFSQAGYKRGFQEAKDNRGNMFFEILKFVKSHSPKILFLENVRHLIRHDEGKTFSVIKDAIENLGYSFNFKVVKASDFGLPQHRPRVFMVCFRKDIIGQELFEFPKPTELQTFMSDIFGEPCNKAIGYTLRVGGKSSGITDRRNWDTYMVNGKIRKITSIEGKKMNGFPNEFIFPVSETQAMKQLGNSVAINTVRAIAKNILKII